jgi:hypothetical protein
VSREESEFNVHQRSTPSVSGFSEILENKTSSVPNEFNEILYEK